MHHQHKLLRRDLGQTYGPAGRVTPPRPGTRPTPRLHLLRQDRDGPRTTLARTDVAVADQAGDEGHSRCYQRRKQVTAVEAAVQYPGALAAGRPVDGTDVGNNLSILAGRCPRVGLERFDH